MLYVATALLIIAAITSMERLWPARREASQRGLNLVLWAIRASLSLTILPLVGSAISLTSRQAGVPGLGIASWPLFLSLPVFVVTQDFAEFLFHRAQHAVPWLWRMHSLHHADPSMNVTTTERHFWADSLLKAVTIWPAVAIALQPSAADFAIYATISLYNYFSHANLKVDFGRWSWVLNSPAYHRLHHSRAAEDHDANFAALFPIFDLLLGSYRRPRGFVETGLERCPRSIADALLWPVRQPVVSGSAPAVAPAAE